MKLKKIAFLSAAAVVVTGLAGCGGKKDKAEKWDDVAAKFMAGVAEFQQNQPVELKDGYTSLLNARAHKKETDDGYYEYGDQKFKVVNTFKSLYSTDYQKEKLNYLINQWSYNNEKYCNMVDGLVENDEYGNIVGCLAVGYKVVTNADDTQTYSFQLRKGVPWITNSSNEIYAEVKAQDFVDALKYVLTPKSGSQTAGIVMSQIKGAKEYFDAETAEEGSGDFNAVGVKAPDDYTVEYTTVNVMPYFLSCLTYSPYLPVNGKFLAAEGTEFGTSEDELLVNGAYRMTQHVRNNAIVYTRNANYWDIDHVYAKQVKLKYLDGAVSTDATPRLWFESGDIDSFSVVQADTEGWKKYVQGDDGKGTVNNPANPICNGVAGWGDRTFCGYFNFKRTAFESNPNKNDAAKAAASKAVKNANFRLGFLYGFNALEYLRRWNKDEPFQRLNRAWTNYDLCSAGGKDYCDYVSDVYNRENGLEGDAKVNLAGVLQGNDPVYNVEKARAKFAAAKQELIAGGLSEADFPITIDTIASTQADTQAFEKAALDTLMKDDEIKKVLNLNYIDPKNDDDQTKWTTTTSDYDFNFLTGWGPDYADPQTYCGCWCYDGDMLNNTGIDKDADLQREILAPYQAKYEAAVAITDPTKTVERYQAFAEAEYTLIYELGIIIPYFSNTGTTASVARTVAHQKGTASYGLTADKYKGIVVTDTAITKEVRAKIDATWNAGKK